LSNKKIFSVFDLGPGDGGKGGVVHKLSCHYNAHTIVKVGGAQGSHGVTAGRNKFAFSQWGCGTFEGVATHITNRMVVNPIGLLQEADALRYIGISNAFDLLTIDENAICSTPYHSCISRLKEMARKDNPRGTIGSGVGEAYRDAQNNIELTIKAGDLNRDLRHKLKTIRDHKITMLEAIVADGFLDSDNDAVNEEIEILQSTQYFEHCVKRFKEVGEIVKVVPSNHLEDKILTKNGNIIVESSHGILTDNVFGFWPHVSAIRTLPELTNTLFSGFDGQIFNVGVHRAYSIRHGAGPLPTADSKMNDILLPGSQKDNNRYQGDVRVGPLDLVLLKYAINVCGGPKSIDCLAITWFDQIQKIGNWRVCDRYNTNSDFFEIDGSIKFNIDTNSSREYQNKLSQELLNVKPVFRDIELTETRIQQHNLCNDELFRYLQVPTSLISFGPSEQDTLIKEMI